MRELVRKLSIKLSVLVLLLSVVFMAGGGANAAIMEDYCIVPPYVAQNVAPNIMIILDNSLSMFSFAYSDGFTTTATADDNDCTNNGSPCTGFATPGAYPTYTFYGYFNPDYWYTYAANRFLPSAPKTGSGLTGARAKDATEWDGNFLNWLTMRRVDVIRKVMTGGKMTGGEGAGFDKLVGEQADSTMWGTFKRITTAAYTDSAYTSVANPDRCIVFSTGGAATPSFTVKTTASCTLAGGTSFNVAVRVPTPVEGVLQSIVGARARIGLSFYKSNDEGSLVQVYVTGSSLSATVNQINLTRPSTYTPLGEALWSVVGYFAQQASISGGPGPRYAAGDFQINNNVDPLNYGTGGQPRWPSCAKSFVLLVTDGEPTHDGNMPATVLNYANGRSVFNCGTPAATNTCPALSATAPETYSFPAQSIEYPTAGVTGDVAGVEDVALYMHTTDLRNNPTLGVNNITGIQNLTLYSVFAFGKGSTLLRYASINGGFEDINGNSIPDLQSEWDNNSDGEPDTFYEATDGAELEEKIKAAFSAMLKRAASGTAASVLASGEGSGANLVQAVFYPRRRFGNDIIAWTGELSNLWYYVDPFFTNSSIREDTDANKELHLINDYIAQFYYDTTTETTRATRFIDSDGDGIANSQTTTVDFENLLNLWQAGKSLWSRDIATDPRTIYTTINGSSLLSGNFSVSNAATLSPYLNVTDLSGNGSTLDEAENAIRFSHGEDITLDANADGVNDYRNRTVNISDVLNVWKLGDVIDSTPRISSWIQLNTYDSIYNDNSYKNFLATAGYTGRGMVFAGANDGMLHAFKLGTLELVTDSANPKLKARLTGTDLGKEIWAFIPKNALPYLKYISDPEYCHVYNIDLSPYIFDASLGAPASGDISAAAKPEDASTWRTIIVGGMRYGGACRSTTTTCSDVSGDGSKDCVNTPVDVSGASIGYSSYFALDVTDQNNPQLLWEFTDPNLGFATTGPTIVRIGDGSKNGKWFAVVGSGPTGPIDTVNQQFLGRSDQNLRLFVLDLKTGALQRTLDTGITYAFAGSMLNATNDTNLDYQDDVMYIGYVKRAGSSPNYTWTNGGVGRLVTKNDSNPANWNWSLVMDNIGPVTSSVAKLQKNSGCAANSTGEGCLWLYFGTGRYYFEQDVVIDDADSQRTLYGVKEPCFSATANIGLIDTACTTAATATHNITAITSVPTETVANSSTLKGWYLNLELSGNYTYAEGGSSVTKGYRAERTITDPLATTSGLVFFTTYKPYSDECGFGGKTFIWAVRYNTGGAGGTLLKGKALLQVSTGSVEQKDLATAFTEQGNRRTSAMEGVPPTAQGLSLLAPPPPVKRVLHMKER